MLTSSELRQRQIADAMALNDLTDEMSRAREKHGDYSLDGKAMTDVTRLAALMEEVGEVGRAMTYDKDHGGELRKELIQVANVAITWATILPRPE